MGRSGSAERLLDSPNRPAGVSYPPPGRREAGNCRTAWDSFR